MGFLRDARKQVVGFPRHDQVERHKGRCKNLMLHQWVGSGMYLVSNAKIGFLLNSVLAALLYLTGKYKSSLTPAGLLNAWLLGP